MNARFDVFTNNIRKSKADFTVREMNFSNISRGTAFVLQGIYETHLIIN